MWVEASIAGLDYAIKSDGQIWRRDGIKLLYPLTPLKNNYGYMRVRIGGKHGKHMLVHRLVAMAFLPNVDKKLTVNHIDFNKENNNVDNLEWATHAEQVKHYWHHPR